MKLPNILSQTLKRFTPNFNSCLPSFFRTRQKPSDLPIDPPISSDSNISNSLRPDQFPESAANFLVKPYSPLSNNNLTLHEALDEYARMHMKAKYPPVSGAAVFGDIITPTDAAGVFSAIKPLEDNAPPQFKRVRAIRHERTYHRPRPRPIGGEPTAHDESRPRFLAPSELTPSNNNLLIPSQLEMTNTRNKYMQNNPFYDAFDSSGSESDVETVDLKSSMALNVLSQFASQATRDLTGGVSALGDALTSGFGLFTNQPPISSTAAPTIPNTSTAQTPPQTQTITEHQRVVAAASALLKTMSFKKPPMPAQVLPNGLENQAATTVATAVQARNTETTGTTRTSPGRLDPRILERFGGGIIPSASRPASPALKPRGDIPPAIPPMPQPQQPISPAQLTQMPSTPAEDPDFPNDLKIKAFNYINEVAKLGFSNLDEVGKVRRFNAATYVINANKGMIRTAENFAVTTVFTSSLGNSSALNDEEKVKLFDFFNKILEFNITDTSKARIDKLQRLMKTIYSNRTEIRAKLDRRIAKDNGEIPTNRSRQR